MNPVDRLQAIIRHRDYRLDPRLQYRAEYEWEDYSLHEMFARLTNSDEDWWRSKFEYDGFLRIWGLARAVDPENKGEVEDRLNSLRAGDVTIFTDDLRGHEAGEDYFAPNYDHTHFLTITVDLERPTDELLELVRKMIDSKRKQRGIRIRRTKSHAIDPWAVWDKMQEPENNLLKIARVMFGVTGNPAYNDETKRAYDRVQRAYAKALSMIEEVGIRRNKPPSDSGPIAKKAFMTFWGEMQHIRCHISNRGLASPK
jgi:hypothetical protein